MWDPFVIYIVNSSTSMANLAQIRTNFAKFAFQANLQPTFGY